MSGLVTYKLQPVGYKTTVPTKFPNWDLLKVSSEIEGLENRVFGELKALPDRNIEDYNDLVIINAEGSSKIEGMKADWFDAQCYRNAKSYEGTNDVITLLACELATNQFSSWIVPNLHTKPEQQIDLKRLHFMLASASYPGHVAGRDWFGFYRAHQNWIGGRSPFLATHVPPAPEDVEPAMDDLDEFIRTSYPSSLIQIAIAHAQFELIHPFLDGNGRVGRALIDAMMLLSIADYHKKFVPVSYYIWQRRGEYYRGLNSYRDGDVETWVKFFLECVEDAVRDSNNLLAKQRHFMEEVDFNTSDLGEMSSRFRRSLRGAY